MLNNLSKSSLCIALILLCFSCKSSETKVERSKALASLEEVLNTKNYRVDIGEVLPFNTATSQRVLSSVLTNRFGDNATRINVHGEGHYLEFKDSMAHADLPFFGEQRMVGSHYGSNQIGITFSSIPKQHSIKKHKRKDAYVVKFSVNDKIDKLEAYDVIMTVFPSMTTDISIASSHRMICNYRGTLEVIE